MAREGFRTVSSPLDPADPVEWQIQLADGVDVELCLVADHIVVNRIAYAFTAVLNFNAAGAPHVRWEYIRRLDSHAVTQGARAKLFRAFQEIGAKLYANKVTWTIGLAEAWERVAGERNRLRESYLQDVEKAEAGIASALAEAEKLRRSLELPVG